MMKLLYVLAAVLSAAFLLTIFASAYYSGEPHSVAYTFGGLALLLVGLAVYFLPTYLAWNRRTNFTAIAVLNLVGGWTLVGWVGALV